MAKSNPTRETAKQEETPMTFGLTALFELMQQGTLATFHAALQAQQATDRMVRGLVEAGMEAQEANARAAKEYVNNLYEVREEWVKQGAEMTEKALTLTPPTVEFPFRREIENFGGQVAEAARKAVEPFVAPLRAAK